MTQLAETISQLQKMQQPIREQLAVEAPTTNNPAQSLEETPLDVGAELEWEGNDGAQDENEEQNLDISEFDLGMDD